MQAFIFSSPFIGGATVSFIARTGAIALLAVRMAYVNRRTGGPFFDRSRLFRSSCTICSRETPRAAACNAQDVPTVQTSPLMTLPQYLMSSGRTVEIANG